MSARIFKEADAPTDVRERLARLKLTIVGYGNQGRAQALNLRDSGAQVQIGNRADDYTERARGDGFFVKAIAEAVADADAVMLLIPDEVAAEVFVRDLHPHLKPNSTLCFASGYCVAFGAIKPPPGFDVVLLAPRMIGRGVRERFQAGAGFYSFFGVEQNATGHAWDQLLTLAWGIGTLRAAAVETTFRMEAELDLFNEQAFGPAFGRVLLAAVDTLLAAGYPREAVLLELYMSGEFSYICQHMADVGLIDQLNDHSPTSQYGAISRSLRFLRMNVADPMRRILRDITSGRFAREWSLEQRTFRLRQRILHLLATHQPIRRIEAQVRRRLGLDQVDRNLQ